jgi:SAM-dependent methyltransferase
LQAFDLLVPPIVGLLAALIFFRWGDGPPLARSAVVLAMCLASAHRPLRFGLSIGAVLWAGAFHDDVDSHVQWRQRSFYGVVKVLGGPRDQFVELWHGNIKHGLRRQSSDPAERNRPLLYYYPNGPIGQLFAALDERLAGRKLAFVGLGVGSLAAYGKAGQELTYFEIDPAVVQIAQDDRYFTFLRDCRAKVRLVLGDARISLAGEADGTFALIVVDAFSGDAIPVHLISREAIELYRRKLAPGGIMAFHISNQYLNLAGVLGNLARDRRLVGLDQNDTHFDPTQGNAASHWVLLAERDDAFADMRHDQRWAPLSGSTNVGVWTDDFSNLWGVFEPQRRFQPTAKQP